MSPAQPLESWSRYERAAVEFFRAWAELPATFRQEFVRSLAELHLGDAPEMEVALAAMLDNLNEEVDK